MVATAFFAGQRVTAALLAGIAPIAAWKVADQSVASNNTTLIQDTALAISVVAGAVYWVECQVKYDAAGPGTGDLKIGFFNPGSVSDQFDWNDNARLTTANVLSAPFGALGTNGTSFAPGQGAGSNQMWTARGLYQSGTLNGTSGVQFRQNTSTATATPLRSGTAPIARRPPPPAPRAPHPAAHAS